jgi:bacteriocin-like protein
MENFFAEVGQELTDEQLAQVVGGTTSTFDPNDPVSSVLAFMPSGLGPSSGVLSQFQHLIPALPTQSTGSTPSTGLGSTPSRSFGSYALSGNKFAGNSYSF